MRKVITILLFLTSEIAYTQMITYDTTVTGASGSAWNVTITRRADWFSRPLSDSTPAFFFCPGLGEIGTDISKLKLYGPHWWLISGGWDGGITLGNGVHYPIFISIQPLTTWSQPSLMLPKLTALTNKLRIKHNSRYASGFSMGGWEWMLVNSFKNTPTDLAWVKFFKVMVNVRGAKPSNTGSSYVGASGLAYPQRIGHYTANGGKMINLDQRYDGGRDMATITTNANDSAAGSAIYVKTQFGDGQHASDVNGSFNPYLGFTTAQNPGVYQQVTGTLNTDWYTYCMRQGDTSLLSGGGDPIPPVANAGTDQVKYMPDNSVTLSGSTSTGTINSYTWSKISGPTEGNFNSTSDANPIVSNLAIGVYQFRLVVTGAAGTDADTVQVTAYGQKSPDCATGSPVKYTLVPSGTQIYYTNLAASFPALKGGDTLAIPVGSYTLIQLQNFTGDSCRPIVITNAGGQVGVTGQFRIYDGRFFKLTGTGHSGTEYGFYCHDHNSSGLLVTYQSSDYICEYIRFSRVVNGVFSKLQVDVNDALTYMPNWEFRNAEYRNILSDSTEGEAFYIGHTLTPSVCSSNDLIPVMYTGFLRIHDNIVTKAGWDGIQVSLSRDSTLIYNNDISEYGNRNRSSQISGIVFGGYSTGRVWNNVIRKGTGTGIAVFGYGLVKVYDNILDSAGTWPAWPTEGAHIPQPSMYFNGNIAECMYTPDPLQMDVRNNCISHPSSYASGAAIRHANTSGNGTAGTITGNTLYDPTLGRSLSTLIISNAGDNITSNTLGTCGVDNPNIPPVSEAGDNQTITLPTNSVTLAGSGSDVDGTVTSNVWSKISGPATFTITSPTSYTSTFTGLVQGTYVLRLTVTDNDGAVHTDDVTITVNAAVNQPPTSNAGTDKSITVPESSVQLNGSGSDTDGSITAYSWVQISGNFCTLDNAAIANPTVSGLIEGTYSFRLTVTDNSGATATDDVTVTVLPSATESFKIRGKKKIVTVQ